MLKHLQQLLAPPRSILLVEAIHPEGTITARTLSGHSITAIGTATVGQYVYIEAGRVIGPAPELVYFELEV